MCSPPGAEDSDLFGGGGGVGDEVLGALEGADLVVNLCGAGEVSRWTEARKRRIRDSRVGPTTALAQAIGSMDVARRPKCFVSASAVGYYGMSDDVAFGETDSPADDFIATVNVAWEAAAAAIDCG